MTRRTQPKAPRLRRAAVTLTATLLAATGARATDGIWNGTNGAWSNPANWSDGVPAVAGDSATFDRSLATYPTVTVDDADVTLSRLAVNLRGSFSFVGARSLTVDLIEPFQDGSVTFNLPVILSPGANGPPTPAPAGPSCSRGRSPPPGPSPSWAKRPAPSTATPPPSPPP